MAEGSSYLPNISDRAGKAYDGNKTCRLTVPANAPVEQYWSATAYDRETHALYGPKKELFEKKTWALPDVEEVR